MRKLNVRLLLAAILASTLLAVGIFFLHRYQVRRQADIYLVRAKEARAEGRMAEAVGLAQKYVALRPADADGLAEYGSLLLERGSVGDAYFVFSEVLLRDPQRDDIRRQMVDLAMMMGRYSDAIGHIEKLQSTGTPVEVELFVALGRCHRALGDYIDAETAFSAAIEQHCEPGVYEEFARMLGDQLDRLDEARVIVDRVFEEHPNDYRSYVIRGTWLLDQSPSDWDPNSSGPDQNDAAWKDATIAVGLAPDAPEVIRLLARAANSEDRISEAREHILDAITKNPKSDFLYAAIAELELHSEDSDAGRAAAIKFLKQGFKQSPESWDLLWRLAGLHLDNDELDEAKAAVETLRESDYPARPLAYLDAQFLIKEENWSEALQKLAGIRRDAIDSPQSSKQIDYWLGVCHGSLGHHDQALVAFRRAISSDPLWIQAREGLATALQSQGNLAESLNEYWLLANLPEAPDSAQIKWAQLQILTNLRQETSEGDWQIVERRLAQLGQSSPELIDVPILRSEMAFHRQNFKSAIEILEAAIDDHPDEEQLHLAQIALMTRIQDPDWSRVDELLHNAKELFGDSAPLRLAEAGTLVKRNPDGAAARLLELAETPADWSLDDQQSLLTRLAGYSRSLGNVETAQKLAERVADLDQDNLSIRLFLFDLVPLQKDDSALQNLLEEIRVIDDEGPFWHYGKAVQLVLRFDEQNDDEDLVQAARHLNNSGAARPFWERIPWLLGAIRQRQGDDAGAIEKYKRALELGERRPEAIARAANLLYRHKRFVEANTLMLRLRAQDHQRPFSAELNRLESEISLQVNDVERALKLAKQTANESDAAEDYLWLSHVQEWNGNDAEAESALRDAIERQPDESRYWLILVQFLGRHGDAERTGSVIAEAHQNVDPKHRALFDAQCYESLNQNEAAEQAYQQALEQDPTDPVALRSFAAFHLSQGSFEPAEPLLRKLMSEEGAAETEDQVWARRMLARGIGVRPERESFNDARKLIAKNLKHNPDSFDDKQVHALIWAARPTKQGRQSAIRLLEELRKEGQELPEEDQIRLAHLYINDNNDWKRGSQLLRELLSRQGSNIPEVMAMYTQLLLQRGEHAEAELWQNRLQRIAPEQRMTAELKWQLLFEAQQYQELDAALNQSREAALAAMADDPSGLGVNAIRRNAAWRESFARSLKAKEESVWAQTFSQAAESAYRDLVADQPENVHLLAGYFARQRDVKRTLEILNEAEDIGKIPVDEVVVMVRLLLDQASESRLSELQSIVERAAQNQEHSVNVMMLLADLHSWQVNVEPAEEYYRGVLEQDPQNSLALNNLAMLIALAENRTSEAMTLIETAIQAFGEVGTLLDTRGVIHLVAGNVPGALADFEAAIKESETADLLFHSSQTLLMLKQPSEAAESFDRALKLGLDRNQLHPLERPVFDQLRQQFSSAQSETSL